MKRIKIMIFILMVLLASWLRCAGIHDAALAGDHFIVTPAGVSDAFGRELTCGKPGESGCGQH